MLLAILVIPGWAQVDQLKWSVVIEKDRDRKKMESAKLGEGKETIQTYDYTLEVDNSWGEAVSGITATLTVVAQVYDWKKENTFKIISTQIKKDVSVGAGQKLSIDFDPVVIRNTLSKQGNTNWKSGHEMAGYLVKVEHQGKEIFTDSKGGKAVRDAIHGAKQ